MITLKLTEPEAMLLDVVLDGVIKQLKAGSSNLIEKCIMNAVIDQITDITSKLDGQLVLTEEERANV